MKEKHSTCLGTRTARLSRAGFTLVEVMTVVAIVGLLSAIAVPNMVRTREGAAASRFSHDLRVGMDSFVEFAMVNGQYPADAGPGVMPQGMDDYLRPVHWTDETSVGGHWDWERNVAGVRAGVAVDSPTFPTPVFEYVDRQIDDGNLTQGMFRERAGGYVALIEP